MSAQNSKPDEVLSAPTAATLMKNKDSVMGLVNSPDAKKLMEMLNQNAGGGLKSAADAAMKGDASALMSLMQQVMGSKEGAAVVERIQNAVPKK